EDVVDNGPGLDDPRPADGAWHAVGAFPVARFLVAEWRRAPIRPRELLRTIVRGIHHNGILIEPQLLELIEQLTDVAVVLNHAVGIDAETGLALTLRLEPRPDVHAGSVPPQEKRLVGLLCVGHEPQGFPGELLIDRFHALLGERAGALDSLRAVGVRPGV